MAAGKKEEIKPCIGCHIGCLGRLFQDKRMGCAVNPQTTSEKELELKPTDTPKNIVVVGGGISGMEAAKSLTLRGHMVSLRYDYFFHRIYCK